MVTRIKTLSRLKHTVLNDVLNDSIILCERIKEDYETKRVLNEQNEIINIKKRVLNDYYFINKFFFKYGNFDLIGILWSTGGIRVEYAFKTYRFKRRFKQTF